MNLTILIKILPVICIILSACSSSPDKKYSEAGLRFSDKPMEVSEDDAFYQTGRKVAILEFYAYKCQYDDDKWNSDARRYFVKNLDKVVMLGEREGLLAFNAGRDQGLTDLEKLWNQSDNDEMCDNMKPLAKEYRGSR